MSFKILVSIRFLELQELDLIETPNHSYLVMM